MWDLDAVRSWLFWERAEKWAGSVKVVASCVPSVAQISYGELSCIEHHARMMSSGWILLQRNKRKESI